MKLSCPIHVNFIQYRHLACITQLFGENKNALFYGPDGHTGIDFSTKGSFKWTFHNILKVFRLKREPSEEEGLIPVVAAHDGNLMVGYNDNYKEGIYMILKSDTEPEYETLYFHLSKLRRWFGDPISWNTQKPEWVKAGTVLGWCGNSGRYTTGPHLHFELRCNGKPINPITYFDDPDVIYYTGYSPKKFIYKGQEISEKESDNLLKIM
jgi:hypothetical protein